MRKPHPPNDGFALPQTDCRAATLFEPRLNKVAGDFGGANIAKAIANRRDMASE